MSEPTTGAPAADQSSNGQATEPAPQTSQQEVDLGDAGKKALATERQARREAEKANKELADRLAKFEDAQKSETEKLADRAAKAEQRATDIETKFKAAQVSQALTTAAVNAQALDLDAVLALAEKRGGIEVDDLGTVTGADKTIAALLKEKPHLFRTAPAGHRDAAAGSPPPALNSDALTAALSAAVGVRQ